MDQREALKTRSLTPSSVFEKNHDTDPLSLTVHKEEIGLARHARTRELPKKFQASRKTENYTKMIIVLCSISQHMLHLESHNNKTAVFSHLKTQLAKIRFYTVLSRIFSYLFPFSRK